MQNTYTDDELVSVAVAAQELQRSPRTILHWIKAGKIKASKLGPGTAAYVISRRELDRVKAEEAA